MSIPDTRPWGTRGWYKPLLTGLGVVLFGTLCFGLGRLSRIEESKPDLVIENDPTIAEPTGSPVGAPNGPARQSLGVGGGEAGQVLGASAKGAYVASKNGTKYYLPNCSGVNRIKEENRIWFATVEQAKARGLTPAANCPGI